MKCENRKDIPNTYGRVDIRVKDAYNIGLKEDALTKYRPKSRYIGVVVVLLTISCSGLAQRETT